jgi:hypothetical protein
MNDKRKRVQSAMSPKQCWDGRVMKVKLLGKKYANGKSFMESYSLTIMVEEDGFGALDRLFTTALLEISKTSEIPADLLEGVSFQFRSPRN